MLPSYNREYVELYNPHPCDTVDISCYILGSNESSFADGPNWGAFTFPQGTKIPPLSFIIIGGNDAQVPFLDFNITNYRQTSFNTQYLTGDNTRWFLRDQWGWIALYDPTGAPVDAVYWNGWPGSAGSLNVEEEYSNPLTVITACGGTKVLAAAKDIPGIEYAGNVSPGSLVSFQRVTDGSTTWFGSPVTPTPRDCNGPCVKPPDLAAMVQPENCGNGDGALTITVTDNGTGPYTHKWHHDTTITSLTITGLTSGPYVITVTDHFDCLFTTDTFWVHDASGPNWTYSILEDETCSQSNGEIEADIWGGTPPYQVTWHTSPLQHTPLISGLTAGTYVIEITDSNNCTKYDTVQLINHKEPILDFSVLSDDTCGYGTGSALASVTGDYHPYTYNWTANPAFNDSLIENLSTGSYSVTVTDGVCDVTELFYIELLPGPVASFTAAPWAVYVEDGVVDFLDQSTGTVVSWAWDFGDGSFGSGPNLSHQYTVLNTYPVSLIVTDENGCQDSVVHDVLVKDVSSAFFPNAFTPDGDGLNDVFKPVDVYLNNYELIIYNRWGEQIYISNDPTEGWDGTVDGTIALMDVYVYSARFSFDYGNHLVRDIRLDGSVFLLR